MDGSGCPGVGSDGEAEAYVYDAYGKVTLWGYRDFDMDRDGDVDSGDTALVSWAYSGPGSPTIDPKADYDLDGDACPLTRLSGRDGMAAA